MNLSGSMCALATPFGDAGALDLEAFGRLIDHQIDGGTEALIVAGSTGEAHMLECDEFTQLVAFAAKRAAGRVPVIAGTGCAATAETIRRTREAHAAGADAALVVTPYYVRPDQNGLVRHFRMVADDGGLPVVLYNVPTRTACDMQPAAVEALREHERIIGIKEAVGDSNRIKALAALAREDFAYLSGDDTTAAEAMLAGAAGLVSVAANLVPRHFRALCDAARGGDRAKATHELDALKELLDALACGPNPVPLKAGLAAIGIGRAAVRAPLFELPQGEARARIAAALAKLDESPVSTTP